MVEETRPSINPPSDRPEPTEPDYITTESLRADRERYYVIDVRNPEEYDSGHIEGAVNVPLDRLSNGFETIPAGKVPLAACGKGGGRSSEAAAILRSLGFLEARRLCGGTKAWLIQPVA